MNTPPATEPRTPVAENDRWFKNEVHPLDAQLKSYLRGAFPSVRDVDDVVQESYLRIWKARTSQPIRSAKAFLFTVARRLALDLIRRECRSPLVQIKNLDELFVLDSRANAADAAVNAQQAELLVDAIDSLPGRCREIFILCQVEGLRQHEVAARLGISENTVAVQVARGLQRCEEFVRRRLNKL